MLVNYTNCSIHVRHHLKYHPHHPYHAPSQLAAHHSEAAPRPEVRARGDEA